MKRALLACLVLVMTVAACSAPAAPGAPSLPSPVPTPLPITPNFFPTPTPLPITPNYFPTPTPAPTPEPIYLNLIFHFHQPATGVDTTTGLAIRPSVRLSALRNYWGLAEALARHPELRIAVSFSPVLLNQLRELAAGARDRHWEMSARDASTLTDQDRRFVVARFFDDMPESTIAAFPRYAELQSMKRAGPERFSEQDVRDLQVWFNLAQLPPGELEQSPLQALVAKGRGFSEMDKQVVLGRMTDIVQRTLPLYRQLQEQGSLDAMTTPYAHPILPLLSSGASATGAGALPLRFPFPQDGATQLEQGVATYQAIFGRAPLGYWPPEGALTQDDLSAIAGAGFKWLAASEHSFAGQSSDASPGRITRDRSGSIQQPDALYRPYHVESAPGSQLAAVFADTLLSDQLLAMAQTQPEAAAKTFVERLTSIRDAFQASNNPGPHLVTLALDGEAVREPFVSQMFAALSESARNHQIESIRLADYMARFPDQLTARAVAGGTWSGHALREWLAPPEAAKAWSYLTRTREFLGGYLVGDKMADAGAIQRAYGALLLAEGSDWIGAYAAGSNAGDREYLDQTFRSLLKQVYVELGAPPPDYINVPVAQPAITRVERPMRGVITPTLDGTAADGEWDSASLAQVSTADGEAVGLIERVYIGANSAMLYARIDASTDWASLPANQEPAEVIHVGLYLRIPDAVEVSRFTRSNVDGEGRAALGFDATHLIEWTLEPAGSASARLYKANSNLGWSPADADALEASALGPILELGAPLKAFDGLRLAGPLKYVIAVTGQSRPTVLAPASGLVEVTVQ